MQTEQAGKDQKERARLVSVDALRGIAALGVTFFHGLNSVNFVVAAATPHVLFTLVALAFSYGYVGVYLFFVISGFCSTLR